MESGKHFRNVNEGPGSVFLEATLNNSQPTLRPPASNTLHFYRFPMSNHLFRLVACSRETVVDVGISILTMILLAESSYFPFHDRTNSCSLLSVT